MRPARPKEEQILVWCGVVAQLTRTRANRILRDAELPYPLFVLLRHFCHDPAREWTVSQLTAAFETEQPGMTKKVQKLRALGLLASRPDDADRRQRWLRVTPAGVRLRNKLVKRLEPDRDHIFRGWSRADVKALHRSLDRLRTQLDLDREHVSEGSLE
ncbi:MAG: MarR family winged helix-turn-helix transcriptional regulator, partial [Myxococcales bacterium]|nr:MarR family winged helix-turn-helix transcriptional regulator [Myxococcales bacterium]